MTTANETAKLTQIDVVRDDSVTMLTPSQLRDMLIERSIQHKGSATAFCSFSAEYNMDDKGKMLKTGNPFIGKGLIKVATTSMMVNFYYDKAVERRTDGEETAKDGNWSQAVIIRGKLTPLSIHKGDIETKVKADADERGLTGYERLEAVYDADGSIIITADEPRCYLRGEFRASESRYMLNGEQVADDKVKPYLPKKKEYGPVKHHNVGLSNVTRLRIDKVEYHIINA